jgi:hypothetical protein
VRVRQFELRLLAVALTVLWALGGGLVLTAYRPGGPVDVLVGIAASLPLLVSVASIVWPPLVRSDRGSAGVFWLGLAAGLLLIPSIAGIGGQVIQGGTEPLIPSFEVIYPWALALLATSLFAGIGVSRQLISEVGIGKRRLAASVAFALASTTAIGCIFAGVSLADDMALSNQPAAHSKFAPANALVAPGSAKSGLGSPGAPVDPPECSGALATARTDALEIDLSGTVDSQAVGTVSLSGSRSGANVSWTAQVTRSDLYGQYGAIRIGSSAWTMAPGTGWVAASAASIDDQTLDLVVLAGALSEANRATAENYGLEYVDGALARHCRVAVDGATFEASFPQVVWLTGSASLSTWRGQLDFWVFQDGEVGLLTGSVNGNAEGILPHGLLATVQVRMTATYRDTPVTISPPSS